MATEKDTKRLLCCCDAICFDVDSTVCIDEVIDAFATYLGCGKEIAQLTADAMKGDVTFRSALKQRLDLMNPKHAQYQSFIEKQSVSFTPRIRELMKLLHKRGAAVYLVSGGFRAFLLPLAKLLDVPAENVYANRLLFDDQGNYTGFDVHEPTSESGGKSRVVDQLRSTHGYNTIVMVGDGATDLETFPNHADAFIGFGGNQVRDKVKKESKWFVTDFKELIDELQEA
ncbi:PREDICTED: phosphoserine phosphatase-like isoform X1 [Priapulus caudatus]|uniref:Phosphoserine phosphatase n=1 Tax=Priapulus caudatus TaxID=37621 RepID=A0ABM1EIP8_PRICU|nr:PREDICTED: phosphoserine phosphatase-like isoform X1 [Priapulus caudatus]XP_014672071.1 PREDICTED: phosphoserine phosphatase-like isoform X1 [Priapulus caudatus]